MATGKLSIKAAVDVLVTIASFAAYAAVPRVAGHGGGRGGTHIGRGGGGHFAGQTHFGGFRSSARQVGGSRPSASRLLAPSSLGNPSFVGHGDVRRSSSGEALSPSNRSATPLRDSVANGRANAVRRELQSGLVAGALHNKDALRDPNARSQIAANAATAGWHNGRGGEGGWWRHAHGGYGWVGPLFWPFANYDLYEYTMWGNGYDNSFWDYSYSDIYAGMFARLMTMTA